MKLKVLFERYAFSGETLSFLRSLLLQNVQLHLRICQEMFAMSSFASVSHFACERSEMTSVYGRPDFSFAGITHPLLSNFHSFLKAKILAIFDC